MIGRVWIFSLRTGAEHIGLYVCDPAKALGAHTQESKCAPPVVIVPQQRSRTPGMWPADLKMQLHEGLKDINGV